MSNCRPMCSDFCAPALNLLMGHIVHSHSPNFNFTCGISGCMVTFRSYFALKKHLQRNHKEILKSPSEVDFSFTQVSSTLSLVMSDQNIDLRLNLYS